MSDGGGGKGVCVCVWGWEGGVYRVNSLSSVHCGWVGQGATSGSFSSSFRLAGEASPGSLVTPPPSHPFTPGRTGETHEGEATQGSCESLVPPKSRKSERAALQLSRARQSRRRRRPGVRDRLGAQVSPILNPWSFRPSVREPAGSSRSAINNLRQPSSQAWSPLLLHPPLRLPLQGHRKRGDTVKSGADVYPSRPSYLVTLL